MGRLAVKMGLNARVGVEVACCDILEFLHYLTFLHHVTLAYLKSSKGCMMENELYAISDIDDITKFSNSIHMTVFCAQCCGRVRNLRRNY